MSEAEVSHGNVLSAQNLSRLMIASLPKSSEPQLRNPYDAIALLCHACMLAVGFRLIGLGEDHKIEATSEADHTKPLPSEWNATTTSNYAFRYAHTQSSLEYLIKVSRLGRKAVINGIGLGDDKVHSSNVPVTDYISKSSLPFTRVADADDDKATQALQDVFISIGRLGDLGALMRTDIIQKLAPGLRKEGYEDSAHAVSQSSTIRPERQPAPGREPEAPSYDPLWDDRLPPFAQPRPIGGDRPLTGPVPDFLPPPFTNEHQDPDPMGPYRGPRRPLGNYGDPDLFPAPLYPHDPLRIPGHGRTGGGGMHPTFDDPLFGGDGGLGGYDPRAPPGARYDPVNPGDGPPSLRGGPRLPRGGFGGGGFGGGGNPFGGFGGNDFI